MSTTSPLAERVSAALGDRTRKDLAEAIGIAPPNLTRLLTQQSYSDRAAELRAVAVALSEALGQEVPPALLLRVLADRLSSPEGILAGQLLGIAAELGVDVAELLPVVEVREPVVVG